jgi:hypothetical protein
MRKPHCRSSLRLCSLSSDLPSREPLCSEITTRYVSASNANFANHSHCVISQDYFTSTRSVAPSCSHHDYCLLLSGRPASGLECELHINSPYQFLSQPFHSLRFVSSLGHYSFLLLGHQVFRRVAATRLQQTLAAVSAYLLHSYQICNMSTTQRSLPYVQ